MDTMLDAFKRVAAGEGREVLLISGEPGLGKTTLVAETARAAFAAGACVLFGHCEEDLATPYQLFGEALGHYVTHAPEDQLVAHVAAHGSELVRLVPALASRIPDLPSSRATDSDTERFLLFAAVVGLLAAVSEQQPVVLVLDDLQWADKASLLLLRHLTASDVSMQTLVLGTFRDSELSQAHALRETLGVLRRSERVSRIELAGLDDNGVVALLEAAAGHALEGGAVDLAHAVYRETDGNPFFVSEVLRHLAETGAISQDAAGRWVAEESLDARTLPDSVREVIGGRVVRLGPDAERVLSMAAVIGRDFDLDLLARATKTSEDALLDILEAAAAAALVREPADTTGRYNFAHALIQHTLYEDLGPNRRARAHRQVAVALEALCGDRPGVRVGELARHWFNATQPVDLVKAISYSRQAGDAAIAALAPAEALRYYAQALDLYPQATNLDPVLALDLAIGLGIAQRQTGDATFRETLLDAAHRAADRDDTDRLVAAALANNRGLYSDIGGVDLEKVEVLEMALERLPAGTADRALVLSTLCQELTAGSTLDRRRALADEAIAIGNACGDDAVIVRVLNHIFIPLMVPPLIEQVLDWTADALVRAERIGDPVLRFWAATERGIAAQFAGDTDETDRCLDLMGSLVERVDEPFLRFRYTWGRAVRAVIAGDTDDAERLANDALEMGTEGGVGDAMLFCAVVFFNVSYQRGTLRDIVPLVEQMAIDAPGLAVILSPVVALAHLEEGRIDDAARLLEEFATTGFELPMDQLWLGAMTTRAEFAIQCRLPSYAGPLFDRLAPWDHLTADHGPVSYFLGGLATLLGRYDDANAYFGQSAATCERMGAKFNAVRTKLMWGTMLIERNTSADLERARDLLSNTHATAAADGYANIERRAAKALQLIN
jgi:tetratricopeptide (TPR) repeat protein